MGRGAFGGEKLPPGAWAGRALGSGLALVLGGALFGGLCGLALGAEVGGIVALCIVSVGGIFWTLARVGVAGIGLGLIGGFAALFSAMEFRHAVATHGSVTTLASLAEWNPASGASAVRVALVSGDEGHRSTRTKTLRGGRGRGDTTVVYSALPLRDGARVVGFSCIASDAPGHSASGGAYALSAEAWHGELDQPCHDAVGASVQGLAKDGVPVAPGASSRIVRVYASEDALRDDHEAGWALWAPCVLLVLYVVVAAVVRARR